MLPNHLRKEGGALSELNTAKNRLPTLESHLFSCENSRRVTILREFSASTTNVEDDSDVTIATESGDKPPLGDRSPRTSHATLSWLRQGFSSQRERVKCFIDVSARLPSARTSAAQLSSAQLSSEWRGTARHGSARLVYGKLSAACLLSFAQSGAERLVKHLTFEPASVERPPHPD